MDMKMEKEVVPAQGKTDGVADDGRRFSAEEECFAYEKRASIRDVMNERSFLIPNSYEEKSECWFILGEEATPVYLISYLEYFLRIYISSWQKKTLAQACLDQKKNQKYYLIGLKIDNSGDNTTFEVLNIDSEEEETKEAITDYEKVLKEYSTLREKLSVFSETN